MNKIKELADQAGVPYSGVSEFAKLIVDECLQEFDAFEIIDRNGAPIEQVVDALMRVKCSISEFIGTTESKLE